MEALSTIVAEGTRDTLAKAVVAAKLGVVEQELGIGSSERLKSMIKTLHKHKHAMVGPRCLALQAQVRLSRRVIKKTHPEDMP